MSWELLEDKKDIVKGDKKWWKFSTKFLESE
jgi:hypothetical protein